MAFISRTILTNTYCLAKINVISKDYLVSEYDSEYRGDKWFCFVV